jgi:hypothetical protein
MNRKLQISTTIFQSEEKHGGQAGTKNAKHPVSFGFSAGSLRGKLYNFYAIGAEGCEYLRGLK